MAGIESNATAVGDWVPPSPTHRNFFSNLMADELDVKSFSNGNDGPVRSREDEKSGAGSRFVSDLQSKTGNVHKPSLTERRAARAGFSAPTIDTDQIRAANFSSSSSDVRSPYLTIPPGLSPTTLLDSPVFLSNSLAQQSPTTGSFSFPQCNSDSFLVGPDRIKHHPHEVIGLESSGVKPPEGSNPFSFMSGGMQSASAIDPCQTLSSPEGSVQSYMEMNLSEREIPAEDITTNQRLANLTIANECSPPPSDPQEEEKGESSLALGAPAEDGYNWRKYGQKHVKGSEYPRSYYKCTHPSCPVKKKVERNHEGQVTEIIYKGSHNHPKPSPTRRSGVPSSHPFNDYQTDANDWRSDSGHVAGLGSGAIEFSKTQEVGELSSTLSNEENEEDGVTHGSASAGCDGEEEETESKRRKLDTIEMSAGSRVGLREPRVVVQTTSEVDILDDGYRWRKYGQKVVKGNPNPRSYYKCTNPGCSVRKHVERASHDLKSVITTYEGKHNHEVPVARGSSGSTGSAASTLVPPTVAPQQLARAQDSFKKYDGPAPLASFSVNGICQIGPGPTRFAFGVGPQGFPAPNLARFSQMALPQVSAFMGQRNPANPGFVVPKGEPREELVSDPNLNMPASGASAYYHQLMGRMSLGPQL